jgi:hypothetical protein
MSTHFDSPTLNPHQNENQSFKMVKNAPKCSKPKENLEIRLNPSKIKPKSIETWIFGFTSNRTVKKKHRSCFEHHVSKVGFEIEGFNILGSRVLWQNSKREERVA